MKEYIKKILFFLLFILPFILGTIGYCLEQAPIQDAAYGAFTLYAINPVIEGDNIFIQMARWLAPLVLASGIFLAVKELGARLRNFFTGSDPDSVTIYSDSSMGEILKKNIPRSILTDSDSVYNSRKNIIIFSDDKKTLEFYSRNREKFSGKNIYIKLDNFYSFRNGDAVRAFNLNDIAAREYWAERNLMKYYTVGNSGGMNVRIGIVGFDDLGEKLLKNGLLANIYSPGQCIEYHIWGDSVLYENLHKDFHTMNSDKIIFHHTAAEEEPDVLTKMDRIILTGSVGYKLLASLCEICIHSEIDCFDPDGIISDIYIDERVRSFGGHEEVFTAENIMTDKLYQAAMKLNHHYAGTYGEASDMESEWDKLNYFTKMSNIAATDYHRVRLMLMEADGSREIDDRVSELEHIRWCRFHFLNHWKYGETADGKKDPENLLHPCLVPFDELSQIDKDKDTESIKTLMEIFADENGHG